jgi:hypothetical protein
MNTYVGRKGYVIVSCDCCASTVEFIGLHQVEEKVKARGWTVRRGKVRCPACTENERITLARSISRLCSY